MKTKEIIAGIWQATCEAELTAHMDMVDYATERGECDYDLSEWLDIESAAIEVRENGFKRVLSSKGLQSGVEAASDS